MKQQIERVVSIDIIRGFALLGIFFVNVPMMQYMMYFEVKPGLEGGIRLFYDLFIQTKFYTIFSFLFGVSAYYFMRSQESKGLAYKQLFIKRVLWLLLFGFIHYVFIWDGDILHSYALIGLLLPLFYKFSPKKILTSAGIVFVLAFVMMQLPVLLQNDFGTVSEPVEYKKNIGELEEEINWTEKAENDSYLSTVKENAQQFIGSMKWFIVNNGELLALSLLGLGLAKAKLFEEFPRYKKAAKKIAILSFLLSLPFIALIIKDFINGYPLAQHLYVWTGGKFLAALYVILFLFMCEYKGMGKRLAPLAAFGKMAFTNYLLQSMITLFIVMPLIKDFTTVKQFMYCVVVLAIQVFLSTMFLKKYRYGPFEWLWRKLVFGSTASNRKIRAFK